MKNIKIITALYILLILLIITLANQGDYLYFIKIFIDKIPYGDKLGHFLLMGLLAFFVNLLFKCAEFKVLKLSFLKGSVIVFFVITLEEFSQIFIETRSFDLGDLGSDYLGILVFGRLAWYINYRLKSSSNS